MATIIDKTHKPCLRPLEAHPLNGENGFAVSVRDPSGLSDVALSLSAPALQLLALMDGSLTAADIQERFFLAIGQRVSIETIEKLIDHLEEAFFLEGERFESYYDGLVEAYRSSGVRVMPHAADLGIVDGSGSIFADMLAGEPESSWPGVIRGVIAPHLDYARGAPCYAAAYATLRNRRAPDRVIILGTNHFGRSTSVVATGNDFATPLGRTEVDRDFLDRLEDACGDLRRYEYDHVVEHSVELQVAFIQHLFGPDRIRIVPILCPDPCGPTGTAPADGEGVDLKSFAHSLRDLINEGDAGGTLIIAGADMSHVGASFGDDRDLEEGFLEEVRARDHDSLDRIRQNGPVGFVAAVAEQENPTRVCSAGCMFVIRSVLHDAAAHVLRYHQAVDVRTQCCVTCAAVVFV